MESKVRGQPARPSLSNQRPFLLLRYDITCHLVTYNSENAENQPMKVRTDMIYVTSRSSSHTHARTHTVLYSYIKGWWEKKKQRDWGNIIVLLTSLLVIKVNHHLNRFEQTSTHTYTHAHTHRCCYYVGAWLIESITDTWCHTHTHTHIENVFISQKSDECLSVKMTAASI